ncbi:MAG: hypothetical protein EB078_04110 [Proteobacteria bacterium]|nr:hypothetical protein [Pseudomonadota bacterium]
MIHSQMEKIVGAMPTSVGTSDVVLTIDTIDYDYVSVTALRASNASTVFASALKIEESDTTVSYSAVPGFTGGTDFTIPAVTDTSSVSIVKLDVDTKARKRYLRVTATPAVSVNTVVSARLSRGVNAPSTASEAGVIGWVKG